MPDESPVMTPSTDHDAAVQLLAFLAGMTLEPEVLSQARAVIAASKATTVAQAASAMQGVSALNAFANALDWVTAKPYTLLN